MSEQTEPSERGWDPLGVGRTVAPRDFEATVIREAALACEMARKHGCGIHVKIGGGFRKRPVEVTITPQGVVE